MNQNIKKATISLKECLSQIEQLRHLENCYVDMIPEMLQDDFNNFIVGKTLSQVNGRIRTYDIAAYYYKVINQGFDYPIHWIDNDEIIKVENVKRPLVIGEILLVPCIVFYGFFKEELPTNAIGKKIITPVFNNEHSDQENGQCEFHYHIDFRFIKHNNDGNFPVIENDNKDYFFVDDFRPKKSNYNKLEYLLLPVINEDFKGATPVSFVDKSKLTSRMVKNNKCPHRGFDLSQVNTINGKKICPLHGLVFCGLTGVLI